MPEDYEVQAGDCVSSIAFAHGFFWQTLWNLPQNADLKALRKNQNVLMPGDSLHIPDLTLKQESRPTDARHKFQLKGTPEVLNMKMLDSNQKPRANLAYIITIEGITRRGKTDANGRLKESIPPHAKSGKLVIPGRADGTGHAEDEVMLLQLGDLNPITEVSGLKARLTNLGFYSGPLDENLDDAAKRAISAFQKKKGLPVTGVADDATKAQLQNLHGH